MAAMKLKPRLQVSSSSSASNSSHVIAHKRNCRLSTVQLRRRRSPFFPLLLSNARVSRSQEKSLNCKLGCTLDQWQQVLLGYALSIGTFL
jgi:hypothetical protein